MPSAIFYGKDDMPMTSQEIKVARKVCDQCSVKRDCLITAVKTNEPYGVWGGYTSYERRAALARNGNDPIKTIVDYDNKTFITPRKRRK